MNRKLLITILISIVALFSNTDIYSQVSTKNGTAQAPNFDFEHWPANDAPEPWGWNSSSCFEAGNSASSFRHSQSIWKSSDVRPKTKGNSSAYIKVTESSWYRYKVPFGTRSYADMGTLTTGTLYYYNDKGNGSSKIYTNKDEVSKKWSFNGRPDSVIFWAKSAISNGNGDFSLYLHNDSKFEDKNPNGTAVGTVIGSATCKISKNNGEWQRISLPISYKSTATPSYMLMSFTAGNNFRTVVRNDAMYVDDVMFIYNPTLSIDDATNKTITFTQNRDSESLTIPFTITGTMSPFNTQADNVVIAYLSDKDGNFNNKTELARVTTDESGSLTVNIPKSLEAGNNYKIRLESTNYPLISNNEIPLTIKYNAEFIATPANFGTATNSGDYNALSSVSSLATSAPYCFFEHWENSAGEIISENTLITISSFTEPISYKAIFKDFTYNVDITQNLSHAGTVQGAGTFSAVTNKTYSVNATPNEGYTFKHWIVNMDGYPTGDKPTSENYAYITDGHIQSNYAFEAIFDTSIYNVIVAHHENGSVQGETTSKHGFSTTLIATPNAGYNFVGWQTIENFNANNSIFISNDSIFTVTPTSDASFAAVFTLEQYTITANTNNINMGGISGVSIGETIADHFTVIDINPIVKVGSEFNYWVINEDTIRNSNYTTTLDRNLDIYAVYSYLLKNLQLSVAPESAGIVSGGGLFEYSSVVNASATANYGYEFLYWVNNPHNDTVRASNLHIAPITQDTAFTAFFKKQDFVVSLSSNVGGKVALDNSNSAILTKEYAYLETVNIYATPDSAHNFIGWVNGSGEKISVEPHMNFVITNNRSLTAKFEIKKLEVLATTSIENCGVITGADTYEYGDTATIKIVLPMYHFVKEWKNGEENIGNATEFKICITEDKNLIAYIDLVEFNVTVISENEINGTVTGSGNYKYNTNAKIEAIPAAGYGFEAWVNESGEEISYTNPDYPTITKDTVFKALFGNDIYNVSVFYNTNGSIQGDGDISQGLSTNLIATPDTGYEFIGWQTADNFNSSSDIFISNDSILTVTPISDTSFAAVFSIKQYAITANTNDANMGGISGLNIGETTDNHFTEISISPIAEIGCEFSYWVINEDTIRNSNYTTTLDRNLDIYAVYSYVLKNIQLSVSPENYGTVSGGGLLEYSSALNASATVNYGYEFLYWINNPHSDTIKTSNLHIAFITQDTAFTAYFKKQDFLVSLSSNIGGKVDLDNLNSTIVTKEYAYLEIVNIYATADSAHNFIGWVNGSDEIISVEPHINVVVTKDSSFTAKFEIKEFEVTANILPNNTSSNISGTGTYKYGDTATIKIELQEGYIVSEWKNGENSISNSTEFKICITENKDITAYIKLEVFNIAVISDNTEYGTVSGANNYEYGSSAIIEATPTYGYEFKAWVNKNNDTVSRNAVYNTTIVANLDLRAVFTPEMFDISLRVNNGARGSVSGSGKYEYGSLINVSAIPNTGFHFVAWEEAGVTCSDITKSNDTIEIEKNRILTAVFENNEYDIELICDIEDAKLTGGGKHLHGTYVDIRAELGDTINFKAWVNENGDTLSIEHFFYHLAIDNVTLKAVVEYVPYKLDVVVTTDSEISEVGGSVEVSGEHRHNSIITLKATPKENYNFSMWTSNGTPVSSENIYSFRLVQDENIQAQFTRIPPELVTTKNNTQQGPNYDFEVWQNDNKAWGWNGAGQSGLGNSASDATRRNNIFRSTETRPNSKGIYSAQIEVTRTTFTSFKSLWVWEGFTWDSKADFGSISTGELFAHPNKDINMNHAFSRVWTNKDNSSKGWTFTSRPDSLVVWVKANENGGRTGSIEAILHSANYFKLIEGEQAGQEVPATNGVPIGSATATFSHNGGNWQRLSVPVIYDTNNPSNPSHLLFTVNTSENMKTCVLGDIVYVDDLMFIYNPTLSINENADTNVTFTHNRDFESITIPFTITGTMSPFNEKADNEVIAYLSDETGSFDNKRELGRIKTDENDSLTVEIPKSIVADTRYKIRLESTNYPLISKTIPLNVKYTATFIASPKEFGATSNSSIIYEALAFGGSTATPAIYCSFVQWEDSLSGDVVTFEESVSITRITKPILYKAIFEDDTYNVNVTQNLSDAGSVEGGGTFSAFLADQTYSVNATTNYGYHFKHWVASIDGNVNEEEPTTEQYTFIANGRIQNDYSFEAIFDINTYNVSVAHSTNGRIQGEGNVDHGDSIALIAIPDEGYEFIGWQITNSSDFISDDSILNVSPISDTSFAAIFTIKQYSVIANINNSDMGNIEGINIGTTNTFDHFTPINLNPTANNGCEFRYWVINNDTIEESTYTTTLDCDLDIYAVYSYTRKNVVLNAIHIKASDQDYGNVSGGGLLEHATALNALASTNYGYKFLYWVNKHNDTIKTPNLSIESITQDTAFTAYFKNKDFLIDLKSNTGGKAVLDNATSTTSAKKYEYREYVNIYAKADFSHNFIGWVGANDEIISNDLNITLFVTKDSSITAKFEIKEFEVSANTYPESNCKIYGAGTYKYGDTATLKIDLDNGYIVKEWKNGETSISNSTEFKMLITENIFLTAYIEPKEFEVVVISENEKYGIVSGSGDYKYEFNAKIEATPAYGYEFKAWVNENNEVISVSNPYFPTITDVTLFKAEFEALNFKSTLYCEPKHAGEISSNNATKYTDTLKIKVKPMYGYELVNIISSNGDNINNSDSINLIINNDIDVTAHFSPIAYSVKTMSDTTKGTTIGDGDFDYATYTTIKAIVKDNYIFTNWTNANSDIIATTTSIRVKVDSNMVYTANFAPKPMLISTSVEPMGAGRININTTEMKKGINSRYGDTISFSVNTNNGFIFSHCVFTNKKGESIQLKGNEMLIEEEGEIRAIFEHEEYTLNVDVNPKDAGNAEGNGKFIYNQSAQLSAEANTHYIFYAYTDTDNNIVSFDPNAQIRIEENTSIIAQFIPESYRLSIERNTFAIVSGSGIYEYRSMVHFKCINTHNGYEFAHWLNSNNDTISFNANDSILIDKDLNLRAIFTPKTFEISLNANYSERGSVIGSGEYEYGTMINIIAIPNTGYHFEAWGEFNEIYSDITEPNFTIEVKENRNLTAIFEANEYNIELSCDNKDVKLIGGGKHLYNSNIKIKAEIGDSLIFKAWLNENGDTISKDQSLTHLVKDNYSLRAIVTPNIHKLHLDIIVNSQSEKKAGIIRINGVDMRNSTAKLAIDHPEESMCAIEGADNSLIVLEAIANKGYAFVMWTADDIPISFNSKYNYKIVKDETLQAHFTKNTFTVKANSNLNSAGNVIGSGEYDENDTLTLSAYANEGYTFEYWVMDTIVLSTNPEYLIENLDEDINIIAYFTESSYKINVSANINIAASTSGSGRYKYGETVTITTTPKNDYNFIAYIHNGDTLSYNASYSFFSNKNMDIKALLVSSHCNIYTSAYPTIGGTVEGGGPYKVGNTANLKAVAAEGYFFDSWVDNEMNTVSTNFDFVTEVKSDAFYTALFIKKTEQAPEKSEVNVYPNPFKTELNIDGSDFSYIHLYNSSGQFVEKITVKSNQTKLNTSNLSPGIYIYAIIRVNGEEERGKVIKY